MAKLGYAATGIIIALLGMAVAMQNQPSDATGNPMDYSRIGPDMAPTIAENGGAYVLNPDGGQKRRYYAREVEQALRVLENNFIAWSDGFWANDAGKTTFTLHFQRMLPKHWEQSKAAIQQLSDWGLISKININFDYGLIFDLTDIENIKSPIDIIATNPKTDYADEICNYNSLPQVNFTVATPDTTLFDRCNLRLFNVTKNERNEITFFRYSTPFEENRKSYSYAHHQHLHISSKHHKEIESSEENSNAKKITFSISTIESWKNLEQFINVEKLHIDNSSLFEGSSSIFQNMNMLEDLTIHTNHINLSDIIYLPNIQKIYIDTPNGINFSEHNGTSNISTAVIKGVDNEDTSGLKQLSNTKTLFIQGRFLTDLEWIRPFQKLETLGIEAPVKDLSPLSSLPRLKTVRLDITRATDFGPLKGIRVTCLDSPPHCPK